MITPAHLIFGLAAFGRDKNRAVTSAALAGAMIPDLSLYLLAGWHLQVLGTEPRVVFGQLYYSEAWQSIFRVDNSFILWGIAAVIAVSLRSGWAVALCGAALLHLLLDFPLHHSDGRAHFWPVSTWIFVSPVSYWDPDHYGGIVSVIEVVLSLLACGLLWRRYSGLKMRVVIGLLGLSVFVPSVMFRLIFSA